MSSQMNDRRWVVGSDEYAVKITVNDAQGFFAKRLVIEPGTKALIIDRGQYIGEVLPGTYTLESFAERLQFWNKKQFSVVLTRQEDISWQMRCESLPTVENLLVGIEVGLSVQMGDVALFLQNLLGARDSSSVDELRNAVQPIVKQALWEVVGRMSITELTSPDVRATFSAQIDRALSMALKRYGLVFVDIRTVAIAHEQYDQQRQRVGQAWLLREDIEQQKQLDELLGKEQFRKIARQEQENELQVLAEQVQIDREESDVSTTIRRVEVRRNMRDAVLSDKFDKIETAEELAQFLHEQDKTGLIRGDEIDEMKSMFEQKKMDRDALRSHLARKLELSQTAELTELRVDFDYAAKAKTLQHEIELARTVDDEESRQWRRQLEKESEEASVRREEREKQVRADLQLAEQESLSLRDQQWQEYLHYQRVDRIKGDIAFEQKQRDVRLKGLEQEFAMKQRRDEAELAKYENDVAGEIDRQTFSNQLEKMQALDLLDRQRVEFEQSLRERDTKFQSDLELMKSDRTAQHELDRLDKLSTMGVDSLIAASASENASLLADVEKRRLEETTNREVKQEVHQTRAEALERLMKQQQEAAERMQQLSQGHNDTVSQAYKDSMEQQQLLSKQMLETFGQIGSAMAGNQAQQGTAFPNPTGQPQNQAVVCTKCRGVNVNTSRFCSNCGNQL